jgi:serine protease inhibitor
MRVAMDKIVSSAEDVFFSLLERREGDNHGIVIIPYTISAKVFVCFTYTYDNGSTILGIATSIDWVCGITRLQFNCGIQFLDNLITPQIFRDSDAFGIG